MTNKGLVIKTDKFQIINYYKINSLQKKKRKLNISKTAPKYV